MKLNGSGFKIGTRFWKRKIGNRFQKSWGTDVETYIIISFVNAENEKNKENWFVDKTFSIKINKKTILEKFVGEFLESYELGNTVQTYN